MDDGCVRVHENVVDVVINFCGRPPTKIDHHNTFLQTLNAPMRSRGTKFLGNLRYNFHRAIMGIVYPRE